MLIQAIKCRRAQGTVAQQHIPPRLKWMTEFTINEWNLDILYQNSTVGLFTQKFPLIIWVL